MLGLVVIVEFLLGKHQCIASTVELDQNQIKGEWPHQEVGSHLVSLIKNGNLFRTLRINLSLFEVTTLLRQL